MADASPNGMPVALAPNQDIKAFEVLGLRVPNINGVPISGARATYAALNLYATDGSQVACAVATAPATSGELGGAVLALLSGRNSLSGEVPSAGVIAAADLIWPDGISSGAKADALASLRARSIVA